MSVRNYLKVEKFNLAHGLRGFSSLRQERQEALPVVVGDCGKEQIDVLLTVEQEADSMAGTGELS